MSKPERISDRKFHNGWAAAPRTRVRAATGAAIGAIAARAKLAGTPFEDELQAGIADGTAGARLLVGLRDGPRALRGTWRRGSPST